MRPAIMRIAALLRMELVGVGATLAHWGLVVLVLAAATAWFGAAGHGIGTIHTVIFNVLLCCSGLLVSTGAFDCFSDKARKVDYLLLPARPWEKLASRFIVVVPLYLLALFAGYWLISIAIDTAFAAIGFDGIDHFDPFGAGSTAVLPVFLAIQGLLVLGAIVFDRQALPRTLALIAAVLVLGALAAWIVLRLGYPDHFSGWRLVEKIHFHTDSSWVTGHGLPMLLHAAFFYLLPVLAWLAAGIALQKKAV